MAVAVAVTGGRGGRRSRRAVRWALGNLEPSDRLVLVHVAAPVSSIPTPSGSHILIDQMRGDLLAMNLQDMKLKSEEIFLPFKKLCRSREVDTLLLEDDNPATALLRYASESGIQSLVLGSSSFNCIMRLLSHLLRKLKGSDVPSTILKLNPNTCNVYVVSRKKVITKLTNITNSDGSTIRQLHLPKQHQKASGPKILTQTERDRSISVTMHGSHSSVESMGNKTLDGLSQEDTEDTYFQALKGGDSSINKTATSHLTILSSSIRKEQLGNANFHSQACREDDCYTPLEDTCSSILSQSTNQSEAHAEAERLRAELDNTLALYNRACEDLVYTKNKAQLLSAECSEEARKVKDALEREEILKRIAEEEKAKHLEVIKEVKEAQQRFARETYIRQKAEMNALKEFSEREEIVDLLLSCDQRYKTYSRDVIEAATEGFSEAKIIGEGGYGKVYRCNLNHVPVAVKVLRLESPDKKEEFLKEVEVLGQLRHPNLVLLLGACPESGSLVYEYMENGSLQDRLFCHDNTPPIPWFLRFSIIYEVACGLAFLHGLKPEPIVHRDLKPGNILLDKNYVSKIADAGLAKILSDIVPDNVTEYRDTILAGTLHYIDPEYLGTGTLRPKSDLYALGVIVLQLLTGKRPLGLITMVENAIKNGSFREILDKSITDWPIIGSEKLAKIALQCSRLRCRERPDLKSEVLPQLEEILDIADGRVKLRQHNIVAPSHYFCPILQDVMEDPYIATDGFTYEHLAIKKWLERYSISPVTKLRLPHNRITPNHSLRSAIKEWKLNTTLSRP